MSLNVSGAGGVNQPDVAAAQSQGAAKVHGEWNGLQVSVPSSPQSLLADAMEEIGFAASEKAEKDLSARKKQEPEKRQELVVPPPPEMLEKMEGDMKEKLAKLLEQVKQGGGSPGALKQALEGFPDPAERHAALGWLERELESQPSLAGQAAREREQLEAESSREIQAGYNIYGVDAGDVGGSAAGGDVYRRTILGHGDATTMLDEIIAREGSVGFLDTVDFLLRAVGADLSAANPSIDKRELEAMNNDLYHLRAIGNFAREFERDIAGLREKGGKIAIPGVGMGAVKLFFKAKDQRIVLVDGLKSIVRLESERDPTYDVRALTKAHKLAHELPIKLFADGEARQRLLDAVQKMLDSAIDLEESLLDEEE